VDTLFQFGGNGATTLSGLEVVMNVCFADNTTSYGTPQCMTSFDDADMATPSKFASVITDAYVVGNFVASGGNHHITFEGQSGGIYAYNTLVVPSTAFWTIENKPSFLPAIDVGQQTNGGGRTRIFRNIVEGTRGQSRLGHEYSNNTILGSRGAIIPYGTVFDSANTTDSQTYTAIKANWKQTANTHGAFTTGLGTYGTPGKPETWSFNQSFVTANTPA
jgi:hypothetical protein